MAFLSELWLPILLAAVFVFVVSSVIHMVLPVHKGDCGKIPAEDAVLDAIRAAGVQPGAYMFPCASSMKEMGSPEMQAKIKRGPVGWLTVVGPDGFNMNTSLMFWFGQCVLIGAIVAYVCWNTLPAGTDYLRVFRISGAVAFMAYGLGALNESIWKGAKWKVTLKFVGDGLAYALVTAGTFGWLWPDAAA